jgi:predicted ATP-grasp superfamily ATP-dependent carboligase
MTSSLLLAGVSVRAFAESATAAGFRVDAIDAFGDLDLRAVATFHALSGAYSPKAVALRSRGLCATLCAYTSNFENHPRELTALVADRILLGNTPEVIRRVRDPFALAQVLPTAPTVLASAPTNGGRWLIKPRRSGGGHAIVEWQRGMPIPRHSVLQERISGTPGSIVFAANGRSVCPLGFTRQLVAADFRYVGNILVPPIDEATKLAEIVTREFGLVGVNGIDFILSDGRPIPLEVNPRYTAAMELAERLYGVSIARVHADACQGKLPDFAPEPRRTTVGKAIVYAKTATVMGDTTSWLADSSVRDIPMPGSRIQVGRPICTVFAEARTVADCEAALRRRTLSTAEVAA